MSGVKLVDVNAPLPEPKAALDAVLPKDVHHRRGRDIDVVALLIEMTQIAPDHRFQQAQVVVLQVRGEVRVVRPRHRNVSGAAKVQRPEPQEVGGGHLDEGRIEGLQFFSHRRREAQGAAILRASGEGD